MSQPHKAGDPATPPADVTIDAICDRFEAAWKRGDELRIEELLQEIEEELSPDALRNLLQVELELRYARGDASALEDYRQRFPAHVTVVEEIFASFEKGNCDTVAHSPIGDLHGLHIRCPHCHSPIELLPDAELESLISWILVWPSVKRPKSR
jgi:hypothetical protein